MIFIAPDLVDDILPFRIPRAASSIDIIEAKTGSGISIQFTFLGNGLWRLEIGLRPCLEAKPTLKGSRQWGPLNQDAKGRIEFHGIFDNTATFSSKEQLKNYTVDQPASSSA